MFEQAFLVSPTSNKYGEIADHVDSMKIPNRDESSLNFFDLIRNKTDYVRIVQEQRSNHEIFLKEH